MADVDVTVEEITRAGLAATYTGSLSTSNVYVVPNDGKTVLHLKKSGAGECTVTVVTPQTVSGLAVTDLTAAVPATTGDVFLGPFPTSFNAAGEDAIRVSFSEITGLTMAALRID